VTELLDGLRQLGLQQFGPLARCVFERWGVYTTEDFGEIVFNLIDAELLSRRPTDSRLDFADGFDFQSTFAGKHQEALERISARLR
jgi:uncharacterized repeat protein (TIGR04138 family)